VFEGQTLFLKNTMIATIFETKKNNSHRSIRPTITLFILINQFVSGL
jgi:hypothetical protein